MKTQTATEEKGLTELQIEAIAHYDRMIAWAKTRPENEFPDCITMFDVLGEAWHGGNCPFCKRYYDEEGTYKNCPLSGEYCCGGLWHKMACTETWGEWVAAAEKVKEYIIEHGGEER